MFFVRIFLYLFCNIEFGLACKDNDNHPVDWWYIYQPPSAAFSSQGSNVYIYITSESTDDAWTPGSNLYTKSMLQNTLAPIYNARRHDRYAILVYDSPSNESVARGVLLARGGAGAWLVHTVPGLPDLNNPSVFPVNELRNGHLIACFSIDLFSANDVAALVRQANPKFKYISIPEDMRDKLPLWNFKTVFTVGKSLKFLNISTVNGMDLFSIVRGPGNHVCLYEAFAKNRNIILDVYGQTRGILSSSVCSNNYSVRNIAGLSIKFLETVFYVNNTHRDFARFAVSTAAHWQKTGSAGPNVFWTCITTLSKEFNNSQGGIITCANHYDVWRSFDILKVKEPECPR